jgi:type IV secretion system protein TrbI
MTDNQPPKAPGFDTPPQPPKVAPDTLELRARPQPVTRINRKVLIGGASVVMVLIAGLVLVALKPPSWRPTTPQELYTVDRKPMSDRLAELPATYDGVGARRPTAAEPPLPHSVKQLQPPAADPVAEADRVEKARLTRLAGQAREAPLLFRLQLKAASLERTGSETRGPVAAPVETSPTGGDLANLAALRAAERTRGLARGDLDPQAADATDQTRKRAFLTAGPEKEVYNPHRLQTPVSPYQLMAGTIIAASMISGLSSDLPGFVIAQVTENVFDSVSGRHLLVPQGSRLIGKYDNVVAFDQDRTLLVWQRIIMPNGSSVVIDNLPATDTGGYAGLSDDVNLHTWKILKGIALATVLGVGNSLAFGNTGSDILNALRESTGQTTNRAGQRLVEKTLNVQPTLTVRPGWPLRVIVHKDIVLRPYRTTPAN